MDGELERAFGLAAIRFEEWTAACRRVVELADREQQQKEGEQ